MSEAEQLAEVRHRVAVWRALVRNMRDLYGGQIDRLLDELESVIGEHDQNQACCLRPADPTKCDHGKRDAHFGGSWCPGPSPAVLPGNPDSWPSVDR